MYCILYVFINFLKIPQHAVTQAKQINIYNSQRFQLKYQEIYFFSRNIPKVYIQLPAQRWTRNFQTLCIELLYATMQQVSVVPFIQLSYVPIQDVVFICPVISACSTGVLIVAKSPPKLWHRERASSHDDPPVVNSQQDMPNATQPFGHQPNSKTNFIHQKFRDRNIQSNGKR